MKIRKSIVRLSVLRAACDLASATKAVRLSSSDLFQAINFLIMTGILPVIIKDDTAPVP